MKRDGESESLSAAASSTARSMSEGVRVPGASSGAETGRVGVVAVAGAVAPVVEHVVEAVWKLGSADWVAD